MGANVSHVFMFTSLEASASWIPDGSDFHNHDAVPPRSALGPARAMLRAHRGRRKRDETESPEVRREGDMHKFVLAAAFCTLLALVVAVPASSAGRPPSFRCNPDGTVCQFSFSFPFGPVDSGFGCGSGPSAFEIFNQGVESDQGTFWQDQNGNMTKIFDQVVVTGGMWSNPLTGDVVRYTQHNTETTVFAVPGDSSTATLTITGENIYRTASGTGKFVFLAPGRQVFDPTGGLISTTPNNGFMEAIFQGDTHAFDQVCAALGA